MVKITSVSLIRTLYTANHVHRRTVSNAGLHAAEACALRIVVSRNANLADSEASSCRLPAILHQIAVRFACYHGYRLYWGVKSPLLDLNVFGTSTIWC